MAAAALVVTGDLVTMDPARPRARAVAVVDGRIAAVGTRDEALAAVPAGTRELALPGTVLPGFIDSHVHMLWGGREADRVDVSSSRSVPELLDRIAAHAAAHPGSGWLAGSAGLDPEDLAEGRFPTRDELDAASGGRPLFLDRRSHDALVNGAALRAAGIDRDASDPVGGVIERDAAGEPTGFLVERPAAELVERLLPTPGADDRARWLAAIQPRFLRAGITSIVDPALLPEELLAYRAAAEDGRLTVRTTAMPLGDGEVPPVERERAFLDAGLALDDRDGDVLRIGPWKLFLDGGGSLGTALLDEPWPGTDGYHGNQTTETAALRAYALRAAETGQGLGVHCVGTAAIELCLDAFAAADAVRPIRDLGFTLIHAYLWPTAAQMARTRELGVLVATQSLLQYSFGPGLIRRWGEERTGRAHPLRSWLEAGVTVGGGSDGPGSDAIDPLVAFWQMQRRTVAGRDDPIGPDEALSAEQAVSLFTTGAATIARAEDRGRLVPGAVADLVACDVDPLTASPEACRDGAVLATLVGGRIVHDAR
ncbi:amidohydrolase [Patulibacter defluvii]|uniref:amidohydrolase n=1 Tax=Patulibacter defluvii TaxID=3095358 RepID=UPI002A74B964|nr:amidohydrolase [Patulibacter sp. DM4]